MNFKEEFIELCRLNVASVHVGSVELIQTDTLIELAEKCIGHKFPDSYRDFLKEFCFAEIFGEEIFSLYPEYYDKSSNRDIWYPGDISYQYSTNKKRNSKKDENIVEICHTGFDDELFYDFRHYHEETNECDIFIQWPGGEPKIYARTFYEFLCKRIKVYMN